MKPARLALIRARITSWRALHRPKNPVPRWVRRHARQINGDQARRRNRKARARYGRLVAAKGARR